MKKIILTFVIVLLAATGARAQLLISGVVDGTNTGGIPKAIEIYATVAITDLSTFYVARDTNGAGPWDTFYQLPSVALALGDFFYIAGATDSATILDGFGFTPNVTNSIANVNGDDIIGLATGTTGASVFDSFGVEAQGDTNFYENSFAVRLNTSVTPLLTGTDGSNFTITAYSDAGLTGGSGFGTYSPVPEPAVCALFGVGAMFWVLRRRRTACG